jgi:hypothetical protein
MVGDMQGAQADLLLAAEVAAVAAQVARVYLYQHPIQLLVMAALVSNYLLPLEIQSPGWVLLGLLPHLYQLVTILLVSIGLLVAAAADSIFRVQV